MSALGRSVRLRSADTLVIRCLEEEEGGEEEEGVEEMASSLAACEPPRENPAK